MLLYERYNSENHTEIVSLSYEHGKMVYKIRVTDEDNMLGSTSLHSADEYYLWNGDFKSIEMSFNVADLIACMKETRSIPQLKEFQINMNTEEHSLENYIFEGSKLSVSNRPDDFLLYGLMYGNHCGTEVEACLDLSGVFRLAFSEEKSMFEQGIEALELLVASDNDVEQQSVFDKQIGMTVGVTTGTQFMVTQTNNTVLNDGTGKPFLSKSYVLRNIATGVEVIHVDTDFKLL